MLYVCFYTLSHKGQDYGGKKNLEVKMCDLIFSTTLSKTFLILRGIQKHIVINNVGDQLYATITLY